MVVGGGGLYNNVFSIFCKVSKKKKTFYRRNNSAIHGIRYMYQSQKCQTFIEQLIAIENQQRRTDRNWFSSKYKFNSSMFLLFDNEQSVKEKSDKVTVISVANLFLLISRSPLPLSLLHKIL